MYGCLARRETVVASGEGNWRPGNKGLDIDLYSTVFPILF